MHTRSRNFALWRQAWCVFCFALMLALVPSVGPAGAAPKVVASIKPLHSLAAGVMGEVGQVKLLVRGAASPHSYSLRPSDARALGEADVVFWIGAGLEAFLEKPIAALHRRTRVVSLAMGKDDPHPWLDPRNAEAMVQTMVAALSAADPGNAGQFARNGARVTARLRALDGELARMLRPVENVPYVVFHDAYGSFARRYGLNQRGALTTSPERPPGARRLNEVRKMIRAAGVVCVFAEPQFQPALVRTVVQGTPARIATLDPLGVALAPGPDAYFSLLRNLARALADCLMPRN